MLFKTYIHTYILCIHYVVISNFFFLLFFTNTLRRLNVLDI